MSKRLKHSERGNRRMWLHTFFQVTVIGIVLLFASACAPKVKVQAPDKPIEINMNVKIEHEIRVKVEKDVEALLENNPNLF